LRSGEARLMSEEREESDTTARRLFLTLII